MPALYWKGEGETGIEWQSQWVRLSSLRVFSDYELEPESELWEVAQYVQAVKDQQSLDRALISVCNQIYSLKTIANIQPGEEIKRWESGDLDRGPEG